MRTALDANLHSVYRYGSVATDGRGPEADAPAEQPMDRLGGWLTAEYARES